MPDTQKLKELSIDDLLQELRAREAKAKNIPLAIPLEPSENLREFDDASITEVLKENQKVIYGTDDRVDIFLLPAGPNLDDVDSVVALFDGGDVIDNGTSTLQTQNFGAARNLCVGERFRDQPIGAFCSGFLVAPDIIATAGHCVNASNVTDIRFVFGFRMQNQTTAQAIINNAEIYRGIAIIGRQEVGNGPDWALVRVDRPVTNHRVARIRRAGRIGNGQAVHVIGHPSGLPTKFAGGAVVRDNQPNAFFVANLDTYGGNSGSPVFNSNTHEVEGILVRGEADFVQQGNCTISLVCPNTGCRGEDCTRTTEFAQLVPVNIPTGPVAQGDDMQPGEVLNPDQSITSANGRYRFIYQGDGNLVLYDGGMPLWASNTDGRPVGVCIMQSDGNLVIYGPDANPIWSSDTWQHPGSRLLVQDDGNVVIYRPDGVPVWATNTWLPLGPVAQGDDMQPGEVLNPDQSITSANGRYRFIYQGDGNLVLYDGGMPLWASNTDGRPVGVCIMQSDGNLVIYARGGQAIWSSDTWQHPGSRLLVQDDGNVVIYRPDGVPVWATNTVQP